MMYQDPKTGRVLEVEERETVKLSILKGLGWTVVAQDGALGAAINPEGVPLIVTDVKLYVEAPKAAKPQAPPAGTAVETAEPAGPPAVTVEAPEPVTKAAKGKAN